ncbi:hypothetical protein V5738_06365 [Salinisphaera sp. SPP-AMP-43]|uniref:hypothetical protein n=1 Tax=Salinisphaera sp. SPP-AMP-43 TaxID=3121288 RepID=UPI003C6E8AC4
MFTSKDRCMASIRGDEIDPKKHRPRQFSKNHNTGSTVSVSVASVVRSGIPFDLDNTDQGRRRSILLQRPAAVQHAALALSDIRGQAFAPTRALRGDCLPLACLGEIATSIHVGGHGDQKDCVRDCGNMRLTGLRWYIGPISVHGRFCHG